MTNMLPTGLGALLLLAAADLLAMPRSRFHSWRSLLLMYAMRRSSLLLGQYGWRRARGGYHALHAAQEGFVLGVLRRHQESDYGRRHGFSQIHSLQDFRRMQPLTDYNHFKPYIDRTMAGDLRALYGPGETVTQYYCSSGTTGSSKYIPMTKSGMTQAFLYMMGVVHHFLRDTYSAPNLLKMMILPTAPRWRYTKDKVRIGPASGYNWTSPFMSSQYSLPYEANVITSEAEALHVSLLFALRDPDIELWDAGFASGLWSQLQFLEQHWRTIVHDIGAGRLSPELNISAEHRVIINGLLSPEPERAAELRRQFERGFDGIVPRLFPRMQVVAAIYSGTSMAVYSEKCTRYLGHLPLLSAVYGASETVIGINVRGPGEPPAYALIPGFNFIEFLPVDAAGEADADAEPLLASEVETNCLYEIVVTNASGFYRYRIGDIVRVNGSYHQSPTFDFQFRAKQMLNVHMEKVSEAAFTAVLQQAVAAWPGQLLIDFTTAESVLDPAPGAGPSHYLVLLELSGDTAPTQEQLGEIDATLQQQHEVYKSFRLKDAIGPMRVLLVRAGTFAAFRQHVLDTTQATMHQFKQPRVLQTQEQVRFFMNKVK